MTQKIPSQKSRAKTKLVARIIRDLHVVMKRDTTNVIEIGKLLLEWQENSDRDFLSQLEREFRLSKSTAYNYINAAKFARKFPTVGNSRLAPSALYLLGGLDDDDDTFTLEVIKAILAEAKKTWVNEDRCWEIAEPPSDKPEGEEAPKEDEPIEPDGEEDDPNKILDGPAPVLPPSPPPKLSDDEVLQATFREATKKIQPLTTKTVGRFVGAIEWKDLLKISEFFDGLRKFTEKRSLSYPDEPVDPVCRIAELEMEKYKLECENIGLKSELDELKARIAEREKSPATEGAA